MSRKESRSYELVGIRDAGDGIIGPRDRIILKDGEGRRHEYYLGDFQAREFLRHLGTEAGQIIGMRWGQAQGRLMYLQYLRSAKKMASSGDTACLDEVLRQAEHCARMADMALDESRVKEMREIRESVHWPTD